MGKGIATAGIWIGVGLIGLSDTQGWSAVCCLFALLATVAVWQPRLFFDRPLEVGQFSLTEALELSLITKDQLIAELKRREELE